ncbi:RluA family pseudouridine synthase [Treponema sp.]|uniref:RluA family pseudouridine synthase n=1 Tax=Treponema sp. TaxID=166 RepID=UPI00388D26D6
MDFRIFNAAKDDSGRRLDKVVSRIFESNCISSGIFPLIRKGMIKVNGKKSSGDYRVCEGDSISVAEFLFGNSNKLEQQEAMEREFPFSLEDITVFKNEHILIVNKPSGINVQPSKDCDFCLCDLVEYDFRNNGGQSISFRPGPLHRIDRYTSGLVAFSQSLQGAKWFTENIEAHSVGKKYLGIVEGSYGVPFERYVDLILVPENSDKNYGTVIAGGKNGKEAITVAKFLKQTEVMGNECSLVEFSIETGRKHQIRAQSALHGHPLIGDTAYGGKELKNRMFFLHAWKLSFPQNPVGLPHEITAPCPFFNGI